MVLLLATTAMTSALAWQAYRSATAHRALAEQVLQDYAELAAAEFARRATAFVGNYGIAIGLRALDDAFAAATRDLPERAALERVMPLQSRRAIELIGPIFLIDDAGALVNDGEPLPSQISNQLVRLARDGGTEPRGMVSSGREQQLYVMAPAQRGSTWLGFAVCSHALRAWLDEFAATEPLLPPSLAADEHARSALQVSLKDPSGALWFRSPGDSPVTPVIASRELGGTPTIPVLSRFIVEVALDPKVAPTLVIGGLPAAQTPLLLALMALSAALTVGALLQMRRERRHAAARAEFVARASHELRTPVARIRMFAETLLLERVRSPAERRQTIEALNRGARRLSALIDNVLHVSAQGRSEIQRQRTDLALLVREVVAEFTISSGDAVTISLEVPDMLPLSIDPQAIRQVMTNLLDNAWKYGGDAPRVRVTMHAAADEVIVGVEDDGPGVPAADRRRIWEPYVRLDRERRSAVAGTGIGLAVVRDLVARHAGRCWAESAPGGGARFVIALPYRRPVMEAAT